MQGESTKSDFDFLIGKWKVTNKRLKERLVGSNEWGDEFYGELEVKKTLGGYANVDEYKAELNGKKFYAVTTRVFDPNKKIWRIYWLDTFSFEVLPQVEGGFKNERGEFYGEDIFENKKVKLRFEWYIKSETIVHWNQAYFDENKNKWEINWTMDFAKIS